MGIGDNTESTILKMLSAGSMPLIIKNISYDANNNAEYVGIAMQGAASAGPYWRIEKLTWESDGVGGYRVTQSRFSPANSVWDNRASLGYS